MQGDGSVKISIDTIFGLCRKRSAVRSIRDPLSGTTVFESQDGSEPFCEYTEKFTKYKFRGLFVSTVVVG